VERAGSGRRTHFSSKQDLVALLGKMIDELGDNATS
jgi:hypothetical protein